MGDQKEQQGEVVRVSPLWLLIGSVIVVLVFFGFLANYQFHLFLRALGVWLIIDAAWSICLRHEEFTKYMEPRQLFEIFFRAVRLAWGMVLVLAVA